MRKSNLILLTLLPTLVVVYPLGQMCRPEPHAAWPRDTVQTAPAKPAKKAAPAVKKTKGKTTTKRIKTYNQPKKTKK